MLIDSHCHLSFPDYDTDRDEVLTRARKSGVGLFIDVGAEPESNRRAAALAHRESDVYATAGLHPHSAQDAPPGYSDTIREMITSSKRIVAVGETGLDYFRCPTPRPLQQQVFGELIELAGRLGRPMVVHSREAFDDTIEILARKRESYPKLRVVWHCFTYGPAEMEHVLRAGDTVSFTGIATFPKAQKLRDCLREVPEDRFLLETDCPYLSPEPNRGKRNEPAFLSHIAACCARERKTSEEEVARVTSRNALSFFGVLLSDCGKGAV